VEEQDSVDCLLLSSDEENYFLNSDEAVKEEVITEEATKEEEEAIEEGTKETAVVEEDAVDKSISLKEVVAEKGETVTEKSSTVEAVMKESVSGELVEEKVKEEGVIHSDSKLVVKSVKENGDLVVRAEVIEEVRVPSDLKTEQQRVKFIMTENAKLREKNIALVDVVASVKKEVVSLNDDKEKEKIKYKGQIGRLLEITEPMRKQLGDQKTEINELKEDVDDMGEEVGEVKSNLEQKETQLKQVREELKEASEELQGVRAIAIEGNCKFGRRQGEVRGSV